MSTRSPICDDVDALSPRILSGMLRVTVAAFFAGVLLGAGIMTRVDLLLLAGVFLAFALGLVWVAGMAGGW